MRLPIALAATVLATTAVAQEPERPRSGLPRDVAHEAARLFNETTTLRATSRLEIAEGRVVEGDVAVLDGPLFIGGHVRGRVVAVNSDVVLRPSARIDGDLFVVGGEVEGRHLAFVGGEIRIYRQRLRYAQEGDELVVAGSSGPDEDGWWRRWERSPRRSSSKLQIASAGAYNRVEGLPINLGPQIYQHASWGSARLDAYAVLRTETSFAGESDDVGHNVATELRFGRRGGAMIGGRLYNVIEPTETWQLSNLEAGLASFLLRRDYRDYYARHGGSVRAGLFVRRGADVSVSYGDERWLARPTEDPWTLLYRGKGWRSNPAFDVGRAHLLNSTLRIDTRNDDENPWFGWYVIADLEHGWADISEYAPRALPIGQYSPPSIHYARGLVDVRRYNRLSKSSQLNLRLVAGGWLNGDPLPLQKRFAVDGPGAMPGYDFRSRTMLNTLTCTSGGYVAGVPGQCDRMALLQAEYRGDLHLDLFGDWDDDHYMRNRSEGVWVFFADVGRGWLVGSPTDELTYGRSTLPPLSSFRSDLGVGLDFGAIGAYVAKAMSKPTEPANFFVRIRHRF